jgi:hypothetical protein
VAEVEALEGEPAAASVQTDATAAAEAEPEGIVAEVTEAPETAVPEAQVAPSADSVIDIPVTEEELATAVEEFTVTEEQLWEAGRIDEYDLEGEDAEAADKRRQDRRRRRELVFDEEAGVVVARRKRKRGGTSIGEEWDADLGLD